MTDQPPSFAIQPTSKNIFPFIPVVPSKRNTGQLTRTISSTPDLSKLREPSLPEANMSTLSLNEDIDKGASAVFEKKAQSESSLSAMTPDSTQGASLAAGGEPKPSVDADKQFFFKACDADDVFGQRSGSSPPGRGVVAGSSSSGPVAQTRVDLATPIAFQQNPRADRMNSPITPANAQGVLPPEACVFVANLAMQRTDGELELSCHEHFDVFGNCHIKVRRDRHRHPFALVQYYTIEDANEAVRSSRDIVIDGRNVRTEHAQARRSLVISRVDGRMVTNEEARNVLGQFGPINQVHPTTNGDAREFGLPQGLWVQFTYYLDYKDALRSFPSSSSQYRISIPPEVEPHTRPSPGGSPNVRGLRTPRSVTDRKSIFVGNLPSQATEQDLRDVFNVYGAIRAINVIHKPIQGGPGYNVFGFIEFTTINEANNAATAEVELEGIKIRVEPKEYSARRHTRLQPFSPLLTPFNRGRTHNLHQIYNQNIPVGYNPGYFTAQDMSYASGIYNPNVNDISPFHQGGFNSLYATPPSSSRMMHRNDMMFSGSPHTMQPWSPHVGASGYGGAMMQIPEEFNGQHY